MAKIFVLSSIGALAIAVEGASFLSSPALVHRLHHDTIRQALRDVLPQPKGSLPRRRADVSEQNNGERNVDSHLRRHVQATDECPGTPFLWKIFEDSSGKHVGFGVGTMHLPRDVVATPEAYKSIEAAIGDSCDVYGELNFYNENATAEFEECAESFITNSATVNDIPDEALKQSVLEKLTQVVLKIINAGGIDIDLEQMTAEELAGTLAPRLGDTPLSTVQSLIVYANTPEYFELYNHTLYGGGGTISLDNSMLKLGRPADDLEDVASQCEILPLLYPSAQDLASNFELYSAGIQESLTSSLSQEVQMYKCGNIDAFVEATTEGAMALDESTDDAILTVRNQNMAKRIDEILQAEQGEERMMFAVGVAHWIIGDQSLEVLLKEKGYSLEHVPEWDAEQTEDHTNDHCGVMMHPENGLFVEDHGVPAMSPTDNGGTREPTHSVVKPTYFDNSTETIYSLTENDNSTSSGLVTSPTTVNPTNKPSGEGGDVQAPTPTTPSSPTTPQTSSSAMISASKMILLVGSGFIYLLSLSS